MVPPIFSALISGMKTTTGHSAFSSSSAEFAFSIPQTLLQYSMTAT